MVARSSLRRRGTGDRESLCHTAAGQKAVFMLARLKNSLPWLGMTVALCAWIGCQSPAPLSSEPQPGPGASARSSFAPRHDLSQDESAGGHTLKRHVGRTDDQLRERLQRERNISSASTYTDLPTAERAVGQAWHQNQSKIERCLHREGGHPNLVIDYDSGVPLGRTLHRGDDQPQP